MRASHQGLTGFLLAGLVVFGCDAGAVELGRIKWLGYGAQIEAPASAQVGEEFVITVQTYADGCISFERTDLELMSNGADVTPLDLRDTRESCPLAITTIPHAVTLSFSMSGSKTINIHGRHVDCFEEHCSVDERIEVPISVRIE
jgi:hypothetical protein